MRSSVWVCHSWKFTSPTSMRGSETVADPCSRAQPWGWCAGSASSVTSSRCVVWSRICRRMTDSRPRRLAALADGITAAHMDGLLVSGAANVRYLTGFSGSSALLFVTQRETLLITDFRYQTQALEEVGDIARVVIESHSLWTGLWQNLAELSHVEVA